MFRVFAAPGLLTAHQAVILLRLKQLPFKVYCSNITSSLLFSLIYRARNPFCTLTPSGRSIIPIWRLTEAIEYDEDIAACVSVDKGDITYSKLILHQTLGQKDWIKSVKLHEPQRMRLDRHTHPNLHLACWCTVLYSCWWLTKVGGMFRYIRNDGRHFVYLCLRYFWLAPLRTLSRPVELYISRIMREVQGFTGVTEASSQYYEEHFRRVCVALEEHFRQQHEQIHKNKSTPRFLLGTRFPTLADVTLAAAFATFFNFDNPPSQMVASEFPHLLAYTERMTGWKGGLIFGPNEYNEDVVDHVQDINTTINHDNNVNVNSGESEREVYEEEEDADVVPETLASFFAQQAEVFPFMVSQCAALRAYVNSNDLLKLKRLKLESPWSGCDGYVLPTLTSIMSLMIIDDNIFTVRARSADLELALYAANAVHEMDESSDENDLIEHKEIKNFYEVNANSSEDEERTNDQIKGKEEDNTDLTTLKENEDKNIYLLDEVDPVDDDDFHTVIEDAERADYYRVHSGQSRLQREQYQRSLVLEAHNAPSSLRAVSAAANKLTRQVSVQEHLFALKQMLNQMRCPQYTLASVNHRSQSVVAIIPEYQACKARRELAKQRKERRHRSCSTSCKV